MQNFLLELHNLYSSPSIIRVIKIKNFQIGGNMARVGKKRIEPGYSDIGLYDTLLIESIYSVVPINSSLLIITLYSSVITTQNI
jgi:hypothetical protein